MTRFLLPFTLGVVTGCLSLSLLVLATLGYRYRTRKEP